MLKCNVRFIWATSGNLKSREGSSKPEQKISIMQIPESGPTALTIGHIFHMNFKQYKSILFPSHIPTNNTFIDKHSH